MVTTLDIKLQVPGGYKLDIVFETPQDLIDYVNMFKPQADAWGIDLSVKIKETPEQGRRKIVVKG